MKKILIGLTLLISTLSFAENQFLAIEVTKKETQKLSATDAVSALHELCQTKANKLRKTVESVDITRFYLFDKDPSEIENFMNHTDVSAVCILK